jgi:integrase/recombinase XerD
LAEHFGRSPDQLTEAQVRQYLLLRRKQLALNSMRPILGAIKFFYRVTAPRNWATLAAMRLPKGRTIPKVLIPERCWHIISAAETLHLKAALQVAYTCGLRNIDTRHLRPIDIDSDRMLLRVCHSKGRHQRTVPLSQSTLDVLRQYWSEHRNPHWLFPSRANLKQIGAAVKPTSERALQRGLSLIVKSLGWSDAGIVFHTLRHSYATAMLEQGVNLKVLQTYLGHKNLQATEVYLHLTRNADEAARRIVAAIMNGPPQSDLSSKGPTERP